MNVVGMVYFVGKDIKNVDIFYHNEDNCMLLVEFAVLRTSITASLSQYFITAVGNADEFDLVTNGN